VRRAKSDKIGRMSARGFRRRSLSQGIHPASIVLALAAPLFAVGLFAQEPTAAPSTPRPAAPAAARPGKELFDMTCQVCHGRAGVGSIGPALRGTKFTKDFVVKTMREGRTGTMMPSFDKRLSLSEIDGVARYVASLQEPDSAEPPTLRGDPTAGENTFFSPVAFACRNCHTFNGRGGKVGPDLSTKVRTLAARDLFQRIVVVPHRSPEARYNTMKVTTKVGQIMTGIRAGETSDVVYFYDTSSLPPILRRLQKSDIAHTERHHESVMPSDYASKFTLQQLLDVVSYLKSAPVALGDVVK
jgi:putative heme-binding domain-containing protein